MSYVDIDLGQNDRGSTVIVTLEGVESDVMLVTASDAARYKSRQQIRYIGGHYKRSPVHLGIPSSGRWHVLVVPGQGGRVKASARVLRAA